MFLLWYTRYICSVLFCFTASPVWWALHSLSWEKVVRNDEVNYIIDQGLVILPDDSFDICILVRCRWRISTTGDLVVSLEEPEDGREFSVFDLSYLSCLKQITCGDHCANLDKGLKNECNIENSWHLCSCRHQVELPAYASAPRGRRARQSDFRICCRCRCLAL